MPFASTSYPWQAVDWRQGVACDKLSLGLTEEASSLAKRTRTKPVRNADGVRVRKDGRPDMRSRSAQPRKVHKWRKQEASHSPTPAIVPYVAAPAGANDTRSPAGVAVLPSATDKHKTIIAKIFPEGLTASRKQQDYASQLFADDCEYSIYT